MFIDKVMEYLYTKPEIIKNVPICLLDSLEYEPNYIDWLDYIMGNRN